MIIILGPIDCNAFVLVHSFVIGYGYFVMR
jgi:hypothetical protein